MNKHEHYINYSYLKNLIDNGYESQRFVFKFLDDSPNSCEVQVIDKGNDSLSVIRFGLSLNKKKEQMATFLTFDKVFFWNNRNSGSW